MSETESAPNTAPTLSSFTALTGGVEDEYKSITHSDLLNASNAADADSDPISISSNDWNNDVPMVRSSVPLVHD